MQNRQRTSIWSVAEDWQSLYVTLFILQFLAVAGLVAWHEINSKAANSWPDTLIAIGETVGGLTIVIAAESLALTEAVMVLARWYQERIDRKADRALAELQRKWEEWNRRRDQAAAEGTPFDDPPPVLDKR